TELFQIDLDRYCVAAVTDYPFVVEVWGNAEGALVRGFYYDLETYVKSFIGLGDPEHYCNSGVFVVDLRKFANCGYQSQMNEFLHQNHSRAIFNDQDPFNFVLKGQIRIVDPRWNAMNNLNFERLDYHTRARLAEVEELYADPFIIHFAGEKPWRTQERFSTFEK